MANDFLITFTVDGNQAIQMMQQIGQVATQTQAQINALNSAGRSSAGAGGGILANLGLAPAQVQGSLRSMQSLADQVAQMAAARQAAGALGFQTGAGTLKTEAIATQQLAQNYVTLAAQYGRTTVQGREYLNRSQELAGSAKQLASQSKIVANQLDDTGQAFGRHARRVFEGILVYEAFAKATQAVQAGISLVIDIDRESRRLQAVLGTTSSATQEFVTALGGIASETVTPFEDLVAQADSASAAFLDIEDPTKRAAAALQLMGDAGKFTSITQHSLAEEIGNLTAIMKQFHIPVEQLDDFLGKITVAGGNSSVIIAGLTDALRVSAQAAEEAGVTFEKGFTDILLASESQFLIATKRTGSEVGGVFKLLITRLANANVVDNVEKITGGMLKLRDAAGKIRNPLAVLADLNALLKTGAIDVTTFNDAFTAFAPPLNPAAVQDFKLIARQLSDLGPIVGQITKASASDLDKLVKQINDALGPQFQKLIIDAQRGFVNLFGPGIIALGKDLIGLIRSIGSALSALPPGLITSVAGFLSLLAAWRVLAFAGKGLFSLLGVGGLVTSIKNLGTSAAAAGAEAAAGGAGMTLFGRGMATAGILVKGLVSQLVVLLPLLAAFMALDFAGKVNEMQSGLKGQIGGEISGKNLDQLLAFRAKVAAEKAKLDKSGTLNPFDIPKEIGNALAAGTLGDSLKEIDAAIAKLRKAGPDAKVSIDDLTGAFKDGATAAAGLTDAAGGTSDAFQKLLDDALKNAEGFAQMTDAQKIAAQAQQLLASLADEQADSLLTLNERLKDGKISQEQWSAGQDLVNRSAQVAANLVAALGDGLRTLIPELGNAGSGTEALAGSLYKMILNSGNSIDVIESISNTILNLAASTGIAAQGLAGMTASAIAMAAVIHAIQTGGLDLIFHPDRLFQIARNAAAQANALLKAIAQLRFQFAHGGSNPFGVGGGGGTTTKPQTPILDIGNLPPDQLAKLIAIATQLRNSIPGETAADKNDIVALIKDAKFLQTVKGIDERLLRIALEQLTKQMEQANELKKQELSNLVVSAGPLSGLITAPNMLGLTGQLSGGGLNFDPKKGSLTINFNGDFTGMSPEQIQKAIYDAIIKAMNDASRQ